MKKKTRIVICDRSQLALNIYEMILKPHEATLFSFLSVAAFRKAFDDSVQIDKIVVNGNALGNTSKDLAWLAEEGALKKTERFFLCSSKQSKLKDLLDKETRSQIILLPFYPASFTKELL